ncbi:MAG: hypothetical protein ABR594_01505 [Pyrinomonadaceae bacterium]
MTSGNKSVLFRQKFVLSFSLLFTLLLSIILHPTTPSAANAEVGRFRSLVAARRAQDSGSCCGEANRKLHLLAGAYYTTNNNFSAKLLLNNKGPLAIEVQPTLFSLTGERFDVPPITVDANSHRFEDFGDWATIAGEQFREGSIQVFHRGKDLVLGTQIYLTDEIHSLSFEEKLTELGKPGSSRLEGVWWLPSPRGAVKLVLSNTTDTVLSVSTTIRGQSPSKEAGDTVDLAGHETKVLDVERDLLARVRGAMSRFGAISVEHNGGPGALLTRGMALDTALGYSLPIQFTDPTTAKSTNLQGAGLRIGKAGKEYLAPMVVVHNAGQTTTLLRGRVPYTTTDGTNGEIILPQIELSPRETELINIAPYARAQGVANDGSVAGLEFEYTGELGSVITSAFSVSRSGNQVFRVPLWDIAAQRSATGGYPWSIEGASSTVLFIKNVTDEVQSYRMYLNLTRGDYVFPKTTVAPHQTSVIDIRELRDNQVPDVNGQIIPLGETRGQVQWSLTGGVDKVLIGRSEQVDLVSGISSNYACQNCCGNSFYDGWLTPVQSTGFQGDQIQFAAMQQDQNCYGQLYPPYQAGLASYTSSDLSVCNPGFSTGTTTGVGPGEALINGAWMGDKWLFTPTGDCDYTPEEVVREAICDILTRRVDSVSPERALIGQPVDVTINGSGFGTGTPTVNGGSGITVSNIQLINGGEVRARFTTATNAPAGNHSVSVTTSSGRQLPSTATSLCRFHPSSFH